MLNDKPSDNIKAKILVVEDDENMNDMICTFLKANKYDTISSMNGDKVLELASTHRPDLIIMDIMLPDTDGITACDNLRKNADTSAIPVIMLTAKNDIQSKLHSYSSGAKRFITKPFKYERLLEEIQKTLWQKNLTEELGVHHDKCGNSGDFGVIPSDMKKCSEPE